jgi:hypothetical protein
MAMTDEQLEAPESLLQPSFLKVIVKVELNPCGTYGDFSCIGRLAEVRMGTVGGPIFGRRASAGAALKL